MTFEHFYLDNISLSQIKTDPSLWKSERPLQNLTLQNGYSRALKGSRWLSSSLLKL